MNRRLLIPLGAGVAVVILWFVALNGPQSSALKDALDARGYRALVIDDAEVGRLSPVSSEDPFPAHLDLIDIVAVKPHHQIDPPWREDRYNELDWAGRLVTKASSDDPRERILAAAQTESGVLGAAKLRSVGVRAAGTDGALRGGGRSSFGL